jgi:predicted enzyme related to lactoylglutathione lyase
VTGITRIDHLHLHVGEIDRAVRFYEKAFGAEAAFRVGDQLVFIRLAGGDTLIALDGRAEGERNPAHAGLVLGEGVDLDAAVRGVGAAGGKLVQRGEHAPGLAYAYVADPDGNVLELS